MALKRLKLASLLERRSNLAFRRAYRRALESGSRVLVSEGGVIYEVERNGARKAIKVIEPPATYARGQKFRIK